MGKQVDSSTYLLGRSEEESSRLEDQARRLRDVTQTVLSQLSLSPGMSCLDVGCGTGDGMRLMGQYVGKSGKVTGLDIDGNLGHSTAESLNSTGISTFKFVQGDVNEVGAIEPEAYDLTFARLLLLHVSDPVQTISRMWEWTKPGGYLVVMDYDFHTQGTYPSLEVVDEYTRVVFEIFAATDRDARVGYKLPSYVSQACGGSPVESHVYAIMLPMSEIADLLSATYKSLLPAALKLGITTEEKAVEFLTAMDGARTSSAQYLSPMVISAWKQKP